MASSSDSASPHDSDSTHDSDPLVTTRSTAFSIARAVSTRHNPRNLEGPWHASWTASLNDAIRVSAARCELRDSDAPGYLSLAPQLEFYGNGPDILENIIDEKTQRLKQDRQLLRLLRLRKAILRRILRSEPSVVPGRPLLRNQVRVRRLMQDIKAGNALSGAQVAARQEELRRLKRERDDRDDALNSHIGADDSFGSTLRSIHDGRAITVAPDFTVEELIGSDLDSSLQVTSEDEEDAVEEVEATAEEIEGSDEEIEGSDEEIEGSDEEINDSDEEIEGSDEEINDSDEEIDDLDDSDEDQEGDDKKRPILGLGYLLHAAINVAAGRRVMFLELKALPSRKEGYSTSIRLTPEKTTRLVGALKHHFEHAMRDLLVYATLHFAFDTCEEGNTLFLIAAVGSFWRYTTIKRTDLPRRVIKTVKRLEPGRNVNSGIINEVEHDDLTHWYNRFKEVGLAHETHPVLDCYLLGTPTSDEVLVEQFDNLHQRLLARTEV